MSRTVKYEEGIETITTTQPGSIVQALRKIAEMESMDLSKTCRIAFNIYIDKWKSAHPDIEL